MTTPTDVSPPANESGATETPRPRASRLNQALAWVGVVTGGVFIVGAIFFAGFFLSWGLGGSWHGHMGHMGPGSMACCSHMKPGDSMMKPDEHMKPGAMMRPGGMMS